jgi:hypothetical protein
MFPQAGVLWDMKNYFRGSSMQKTLGNTALYAGLVTEKRSY